jgi:hypothetical protein
MEDVKPAPVLTVVENASPAPEASDALASDGVAREVGFKDGAPPPRVRPEIIYLLIILLLASAILTVHLLRGRFPVPRAD